MNHDVPRGTVTQIWPRLLEKAEAEQTGPDYAQECRRVRAAGYADIARLAVDGGPVSEPKPIRRRLTLNIFGVISLGLCALSAVLVILGGYEIIALLLEAWG